MSKNDEEEMVEIDLCLDKDTAKELLGLKKPKLLNRLIVMILRNEVQDKTIADLERQLEFYNKENQRHMRKMKECNEQAAAMLNAIMNRW